METDKELTRIVKSEKRMAYVIEGAVRVEETFRMDVKLELANGAMIA